MANNTLATDFAKAKTEFAALAARLGLTVEEAIERAESDADSQLGLAMVAALYAEDDMTVLNDDSWKTYTCYIPKGETNMYGIDDDGEFATPQQAVEEWRRNACTEDAATCPCRGSGYMLHDRDVWLSCPIHHVVGQRHPEDERCPRCGGEDCCEAPRCVPAPVVAVEPVAKALIEDDGIPF